VSTKVVIGLAAAGFTAEVLRRHYAQKAKTSQVPAQVSAEAMAALATMRVAMPKKRPRDYTEAYIEQKRVLIAESPFEAETEYYCSSNVFAICLPIPSKVIPVSTRDRTREVVAEWLRVADSVRHTGVLDLLVPGPALSAALKDELDDLLGAHIVGLNGLMTSPQGIGAGSSRVPVDVNRRVWSHIGQIALALQGVAIHHGDIQLEAARELLDTVTDPKKYVAAGGDLLGTALQVLGDIVGQGAATFVASNLGAVVIVGGVAYFVLRRSLP
jgi:hypothetical protein